MKFSLDQSLEILKSTPQVISALLGNLSEDWINKNEGENTWTAKEVVAHLIVCEETDWMPRVRLMLSDRLEKNITPIDMQAHFAIAKNNSMQNLLAEFAQWRKNGIEELKKLNLRKEDFIKTAVHPKLGAVSVQELVAAWVAHDLGHLAQIARVMAKQNKEHVGNFREFLSIINK